MKKQANFLTLSLIITSIALLLVLEGFWLRSSYQQEYNQLRREVNFVFRSTMFDMQDSVIQKSIEPLRGDSGVNQIFRRRSSRTEFDTMRFVGKGDRIERKVPLGHDNIQIYINAPAGDSLKSMHFRSLLSKVRGDTSQRTFTLRLMPDTLNRSDIETKFRHMLAMSGIHLSFKVSVLSNNHPSHGNANALTTEWVRGINSGQYMATFSNAPLSIMRKITPQIIFSVFLSALTIVSFVFLYRSIRSQQRLVAIKNDFISNITHELKTPIATVSVALEALKNFKGIENPQLTNDYLDIARYELGRLSLLTDKVLTTSLFEENGVKLELETVDLEKTVNEILHSMKLVFEKRNVAVSFEKEGESFKLQGSSIHLTNVFYNLVDNALKYSTSNPAISIRLTDLDDKVSISVADNGIGIPEEYHSKVFDKFFRVPTGDVHTVKGHGLGLSYVRNVVESHHGQISLKSKPGEGCVFTISLPKAVG